MSPLQPDPICELQAVVGFSGEQPRAVTWCPSGNEVVFPSNNVVIAQVPLLTTPPYPSSLPLSSPLSLPLSSPLSSPLLLTTPPYPSSLPLSSPLFLPLSSPLSSPLLLTTPPYQFWRSETHA
eukprot:3095419-Pyramimonas_sp.AAC.1